MTYETMTEFDKIEEAIELEAEEIAMKEHDAMYELIRATGKLNRLEAMEHAADAIYESLFESAKYAIENDIEDCELEHGADLLEQQQAC